MKIFLKRQPSSNNWTNGKLYIDNILFCDTLEDKDRDLVDSMSEEEIKKIKIYGETAIPKGTYKITLDVVSPKFSQYPFYQTICRGKLPRLLNVKGFDGILIHVADGYKRENLLNGCIGIGDIQKDGSLLNGKETYIELYKKLEQAQEITITIE